MTLADLNLKNAHRRGVRSWFLGGQLSLLPCWLSKSNARPTSVFINEFYPGLFNCFANIFQCSWIGFPCTTFKVRDGLRRRFARLRKVRLRPPEKTASRAALGRAN